MWREKERVWERGRACGRECSREGERVWEGESVERRQTERMWATQGKNVKGRGRG